MKIPHSDASFSAGTSNSLTRAKRSSTIPYASSSA